MENIYIYAEFDNIDINYFNFNLAHFDLLSFCNHLKKISQHQTIVTVPKITIYRSPYIRQRCGDLSKRPSNQINFDKISNPTDLTIERTQLLEYDLNENILLSITGQWSQRQPQQPQSQEPSNDRSSAAEALLTLSAASPKPQ